jgi:aminoglycoside phosphotransferase (APT) family kinase protein
MADEARIMQYMHGQGYPVPAVDSISDDGCDLVMERIDGRSMVDALSRAPWSVRRQAGILADLHIRLHDVQPPDFLRPAPIGTGDRVVHMDLHPLNVILGRQGPVVIDWTLASLGDPAVDVGLAWVLLSAGEIPAGRVLAKVLGVGRTLFMNAFISHFDRHVVAGQLRDVVAWKVQDPHMSASEVEGMWRLVRGEEHRIA